jgi:streptogramin lyase
MGRARLCAVFAVLLLATTVRAPSYVAATVEPASRVYTTDADFATGQSINVVNTTTGQLQLAEETSAFGFIWIAASARGTILKIDTESGEILGEYLSAPDGMGRNPSRTTVDKDGNVWATNRDEGGFVAANAIRPGLPAADTGMGSAFRVGLSENGQCEDRNGNGSIETSTGVGDILPWPNAAGEDGLGGVSTAVDECMLDYVRVHSTGARHISVNGDNDVWASGTGGGIFDLIDGDTGQIVRTEGPVGYGGYGGLIDPNGVIWSASRLLRWDTALPLTGDNGVNWKGYEHSSYGLCIGPDGDVWNTEYGSVTRRFAPDGTLLGEFPHGGSGGAQGCVVDSNGHVWIAHSLSGASVGHLLPDGTHVGDVPLPVSHGPTGVAVDSAGKIWSANINTSDASRIDPTAGPLGSDGVTKVGAVDLTVDLGAGAGPYNYSDMTGSTLTGAASNGSWSAVFDSGAEGTEWGFIEWNGKTKAGNSLRGFASSSADGHDFGPEVEVQSEEDFSVANGRFLKVRIALSRSAGAPSPILNDVTVTTATRQPDGLVARGNKAPLGKDVYNEDAEGQRPEATFGLGQTRKFVLTVQNDGNVPDNYVLTGCNPHPEHDGFATRYYDGETNVTDLVNAGTYETGEIEPGKVKKLNLKLTILKIGLARDRQCLTRIVSVADPTKLDVIAAGLKQKR